MNGSLSCPDLLIAGNVTARNRHVTRRRCSKRRVSGLTFMDEDVPTSLKVDVLEIEPSARASLASLYNEVDGTSGVIRGLQTLLVIPIKPHKDE